MPGPPRTPLSWAASLILVGILGSAVFGHGGILDIRRLRGERTVLEDEIFRRMRENAELRARLQRLRRSDRELEQLARQSLGLVRDDEIVYRFSTKPGSSQHAAVR